MNALEKKSMRLFEEFGIKKLMTITQINKGTIGVRCAIRFKDTGEICGRDIAITPINVEGKDYDDDFFFHVQDIPAFNFLLANLDFVYEDFDSEADWLEEIDKYVGEKDRDNYFNSNEEFDIVDLSEIYIADEGNNEDEMIGTKKIVKGGVLYTPDQTEQGYVFKDFDAIKKKEGICYIAESGFDGTLLLTPDNTWEHINAGAVVTYNSARQQVKDLVYDCFPKFRGNFTQPNNDLFYEFVEKITDYILQEVDWQCFSTMLNEIDLDEELDYFLQDKFAEFAAARLKKDGDDTEFEDNEDLFDKLANYFGEYCYRNDDYSLTDWDSLIDRWEDEPNY